MSHLSEKYTQQFVRDNNLILAEVIIGSYAFGLNTPKSDRDVYGIYYLAKDDFYSLHFKVDQSYKEVVEKSNPKDQDITYMELGKFFGLIANGNPNALELLASFKEEKNVVYLHELLSDIDINKVLTKKCHKSFGEYAVAQIKKARGLNKKIVNPVEVTRKTPLDFCYLMMNGKTRPLSTHFGIDNYDQKFCGVVALSNAKDCYALYYDRVAEALFCGEESLFHLSEKRREEIKELRKKDGLPMGYGFKGIELENSNEIRLSSVPKMEGQAKEEIDFIGYMTYNKDGYVQHCKDYLEYWNWVNNRNEARYENNLKQNYDTKNISHCIRLLTVAKEIAEGKGIILQRTEDRQFLLDIKLGKVEYDVAMAYAEKITNSLEDLYKNSTLPDESDFDYLNDKLISIRKALYK
jgi:uncharacterized protein